MGETLEAQINRHFPKYWALSEDALELELGRQITQLQKEMGEGAKLSCFLPMSTSLGSTQLVRPIGDLRDLAKAFIQRFSRNLYDLVCNPKDPDNKKIVNYLSKGSDALGVGLALYLTSQFGMLPGVATVMGALVAKRFVSAGHGAVCEIWARDLGIKQKGKKSR